MNLSPDLSGLELHDGISLASKRVRFLQWCVDQWPRLHEVENQLAIRGEPPKDPVGGEGIDARLVVVVVGDAAIDWWRVRGDARFDRSSGGSGRYACERIYSWQNFAARIRNWLVINGWEVDRFLRDNAGSPEYASIITRHAAATAAQTESSRAWQIAAAHDADPLLGRLMHAVVQEDVAAMEGLSSEPGTRALGIQESEVPSLCHIFRSADRRAVDVAKRDMAARLGMLTFGVWQSRGQAFLSGPEEALRTEAWQRYSASFETVKTAAQTFYAQRFEQWAAHSELNAIGEQLFSGQAYVDPFARDQTPTP